jgi:DNA-binding HxlR family transcriptional regulator
VIVKQMLLEGKQTFKGFIESDEAIATNILSAKLKLLEELELITKSKLPDNKKTNLYHLTNKGLPLTPLIVELALWSDQNLRELNPIMRKDKELEMMENNKAEFILAVQEQYKSMISTTKG